MTVTYRLSHPGDALLRVYDMHGRLLRSMRNARTSAGRHRAAISLHGLPAGTYLLLLTASNGRDARIFPLLR